MKRALVLGGGAMYGAYDLGALKVFTKEGIVFNTVYAGSSGVFLAGYYASGQIMDFEKIWLGSSVRKIMKLSNILKIKRVMTLDPIIDEIINGNHCLNLEAMLASEVELVFSLTEYPTGNALTVYPKDWPDLIYKIMEASAALYPFVSPVEIKEKKYIDGTLSIPVLLSRALEDGHDEVVLLQNKPLKRGDYDKFWSLSSYLSPIFSEGIENLIRTYPERRDRELDLRSKAQLLCPNSRLPLKHFLDTDLIRLERSMRIGSRDARFFIKEEIPPFRKKMKINKRYIRKIKKEFYGYILGNKTRRKKYRGYYRALRSYKFISLSFKRGNLIELFNIAMRLSDDIADGDLRLPKGYATSADFLEEKIAFLDDLSDPRDKIEVLLVYCHQIALSLGFDIIEEARQILTSLLFDAKRRESSEVFPDKILHENFHRLDIEGAISGTVKIMKGEKDLIPKVIPLGYASRIYYNLRDYEDDIAAGLINISAEDCERLGIPMDSTKLNDRFTKSVRVWFEEQAILGLNLIEDYKTRMKGEKLSRTVRISLNGFEVKAGSYLKKVLEGSL